MATENGNNSEMKIKRLPRYIDIDGSRYCEAFVPDLVRSAIDYEPTSKDIFVATYPKCGTTWMLQIAMLIVKKGKIPNNIPEYFASCPFIEMLGAEEVANIPSSGGCIKTHLPFNLTPYSPDAKYIYVARNPRDCCISFYHHSRLFPGYYFSDGSFNDFFDLFVEGKTDFNDYFDNLLSWYERRHEPNIFFVTFEEVRKDHRGTVKRLAEFLGEGHAPGVADNDELIDEIVHKSSFEYMKKNTNLLWKEMLDSCESFAVNPKVPRGFRAWAKCNADAVKDGEGSVGEFVRNGGIGNKTVLSPEQEDRLKDRILEKTRGSDVMQLWSDMEWGSEACLA